MHYVSYIQSSSQFIIKQGLKKRHRLYSVTLNFDIPFKNEDKKLRCQPSLLRNVHHMKLLDCISFRNYSFHDYGHLLFNNLRDKKQACYQVCLKIYNPIFALNGAFHKSFYSYSNSLNILIITLADLLFTFPQ